ncbi:CdaR family transcriptional regulator [Agrococcus sp. HG114]|uniref:PucR family transcriptional regulator n=1 Tax=Agrococcus sp. HG114 TaxID=2969757 RepID=UPI00215ADC78|nr:helix-turn-helix domain-containing protein [Agrococcus sp. HG114]MCR8670520.1 helix-turn-helix domain-containing protein [Agrococcus sp. HG114]
MSALRLDALLEQPGHGGVELVARAADAWDRVMVEPDESTLGRAPGATFAIVMTVTGTRPWQLDALVRRARDLGISGLALPAGTPVSIGTANLASRVGLTLVTAERPTALARTCWELTTSADALALSLVRRVAQTIQYAARDLPDQLRHLAAGIGHGVALVAPHGIVQQAGPALDPSLVPLIDFDSWVDRLEHPVGTVASVRVDSKGAHRLRLAFHGRALGLRQLAALAAAAEIAMPAVAARLLIDEVEERDDASRSSSLLSELLDPAASHDPELDRRVAERGWTTEGWHAGFAVQGRGRSEPLEVLRLVQPSLAALPARAHATIRGPGVVGWLSFTSAPPREALGAAVRALRDLHGAWLLQLPVATGVGTLQRGLTGFGHTVNEAMDAARLAADRSAASWFLHVDRFGIDQLLMAWTGSDAFLPAAQGLLDPLRDEDRRTLAAYLDHESSLAATATALGVHRNTVAQRIARVEVELGMDLGDPEVRLALQLAVRATRSR